MSGPFDETPPPPPWSRSASGVVAYTQIDPARVYLPDRVDIYKWPMGRRQLFEAEEEGSGRQTCGREAAKKRENWQREEVQSR